MSTTITDQSAYELGTTTRTLYLDPMAAAGAAAVLSAAVMLLLGVFAVIGIYEGAIERLKRVRFVAERQPKVSRRGEVQSIASGDIDYWQGTLDDPIIDKVVQSLAIGSVSPSGPKTSVSK